MTVDDFDEAQTSEFLSLLDEYKYMNVRNGEVTKGYVKSVGRDEVIIYTGTKVEGIVPISEFENEDGVYDVKEGDVVSVMVERLEGDGGYAILSREMALREENWSLFQTVMENREPVRGKFCSGRVRGGYVVRIRGVLTFLPGSQVDSRAIDDITPLMKEPQDFLVVKADKETGTIIVSRRAQLELSRLMSKDLLQVLEEGAIVQGVVKNITSYGAFVDIGGIDGLLHMTDMSWKRINHPSEILKTGQNITAKVIRLNRENRRISLGLKQLQSSPWASVVEKYPIGSKVNGTVTNVVDYGVFVELEPGIEGLVYITEVSWFRSGLSVGNLVKVGDKVDVIVLDIDEEKCRTGLSMRQCYENPWGVFAANNPIGSIFDVGFVRVADIGIVVDVGDSLEGIIEFDDVSWHGKTNEIVRGLKAGARITCKLLAVNRDRRIIRLGIKQTEKDPMEDMLGTLKIGDSVECEVSCLFGDGIEVLFGNGVQVFIADANLAGFDNPGEERAGGYKRGDKRSFVVKTVDAATRTLELTDKELKQKESEVTSQQ